MSKQKKNLTEEQKKALAALAKPLLSFEPKSAEQLAAEKEKAEIESIKNARPGDVMPDGTIYLGYHGGKDWFVTAEDAKDKSGHQLLLDFNGAAAYAKNLRVHGHDDWMVPPGRDDPKQPHNILQEMFNQKNTGAFKGTYDESGGRISSWYGSSSPYRGGASLGWVLKFSDGQGGWQPKHFVAPVRCVRSAPHTS